MEYVLYIAVAGFFRLLSFLPVRLARGIGILVGYGLWWTHSVSRQVTEINLRLCFPEMGKAERRALARLSLQHLGMTAMESGLAWSAPPALSLGKIRRVSGQELWSEAMSAGRGLIILGPHIGNWEILGNYLADQGPVTNMYQPPENPVLDRFIRWARLRGGANLVPTNASGVKNLLRALKHGECVGVLPDQVPPPNSGEFAPFFGVPALTMTLVQSLVQRTGARVLMAYVKRVEGGLFELVFLPVSNAIYDDDRLVSLTALNQGVEATVRDVPEQYQWEYKRFRKQPPGCPKHYRQDKD